MCEHVLGGEGELVREYCKLDCLVTLLVYLVWVAHRGELDAARLRGYVRVIREALGDGPFAGWAEVREQLAGWPAWSRESHVEEVA